MKVLEVFLTEPTKMHFIKEVARRIKLAPTSVRMYFKELLKEGLIKNKEAEPFDGFVANTENKDFVLYKRCYNLYTLKELTNHIVSEYYPKLLVVFGSYSYGEDKEHSDIDILIVSKTKDKITLDKFEKKLNRSIHPVIVKNLDELEKSMIKKVYNGIVLHGGFDE
jgi:predicted nucleotidyltransferase